MPKPACLSPSPSSQNRHVLRWVQLSSSEAQSGSVFRLQLTSGARILIQAVRPPGPPTDPPDRPDLTVSRSCGEGALRAAPVTQHDRRPSYLPSPLGDSTASQTSRWYLLGFSLKISEQKEAAPRAETVSLPHKADSCALPCPSFHSTQQPPAVL